VCLSNILMAVSGPHREKRLLLPFGREERKIVGNKQTAEKEMGNSKKKGVVCAATQGEGETGTHAMLIPTDYRAGNAKEREGEKG